MYLSSHEEPSLRMHTQVHTGTFMHMNSEGGYGAFGHGDPEEGLRGKTTVFS